MGYTGWLMPDGKFYPCKHKEHSETLRDLLEKPQYRRLMADNIEKGKLYNSEPEGCMCFWDTDFKFASFVGEITKEVEKFLIEHFSEFNSEQKDSIYKKFRFLKNKTEEQEEAINQMKEDMRK